MITATYAGHEVELYEDSDASVGLTGQAFLEALRPIADELARGPVAVSWEPGNCTRYDLLLSLREHYTTERARSETAATSPLAVNPDTPWVGWGDDDRVLVIAKTNGRPFVGTFRLADRYLALDYVADKLAIGEDYSTAAVAANFVLALGMML